jgi:hypothetical protein
MRALPAEPPPSAAHHYPRPGDNSHSDTRSHDWRIVVRISVRIIAIRIIVGIVVRGVVAAAVAKSQRHAAAVAVTAAVIEITSPIPAAIIGSNTASDVNGSAAAANRAAARLSEAGRNYQQKGKKGNPEDTHKILVLRPKLSRPAARIKAIP